MDRGIKFSGPAIYTVWSLQWLRENVLMNWALPKIFRWRTVVSKGNFWYGASRCFQESGGLGKSCETWVEGKRVGTLSL